LRSQTVKYLVAGTAAGVINGFFGAGGGVVLVPLLLYWLGLPARKAFATSVFIIFPLSLVSAVLYFMGGRIDLRQAMPYLIGGFVGGVLCGNLFKKMPVIWLRRIFGGLLILGGIRAVIK